MIKYYLLTGIFILNGFILNAQQPTNPKRLKSLYPFNAGKVKNDPYFKYDTTVLKYDSLYRGVFNIKSSKNDIEIRLEVRNRLVPQFYVLTFNKEGMTADKYEGVNGGPSKNKIIRTSLIRHAYINVALSFVDTLFNTLVKNEIFLLPNEMELAIFKKIVRVDDGTAYSLTYKVGDSFRTYYFDNPDDYARNYVNVKEFPEYATIVKCITALFN